MNELTLRGADSMVVNHRVFISGSFKTCLVFRDKSMGFTAWESLSERSDPLDPPNAHVASMSVTPSRNKTYLVKESFGVMGPGDGRKLDKPDLIAEAAFVVVRTLAVNGDKRFAGLTNINRAKVATLHSVIMTVSQL